VNTKTSFTAQEVREQLWALIRNKRQPHHPWTYRTQSELARAMGVSLPFLNDILNRNREPSGKVLEFLMLERVVRYEVRS
jgi:transcriptional regulator with XRE-family HTH domain